MNAQLLDAKVLGIEAALQGAQIPHAFGGAIALAYYGVPRGTEDIDLNVFLAEAQKQTLLDALAPLGVEAPAPTPNARPHQAVWRWEHTPIHLFFSYDPFHESCRARARRVPFSDGEITVLSAEDITLFKVLYDRPKDRSEVREVLLCMGEAFDVAYLRHWLGRIAGPQDPRALGFEAAVSEWLPS